MARSLADLETEISGLNKEVAEMEKRAEISILETKILELQKKKSDLEGSFVTSTPAVERQPASIANNRESGFSTIRRPRKLPSIPVSQSRQVETQGAKPDNRESVNKDTMYDQTQVLELCEICYLRR